MYSVSRVSSYLKNLITTDPYLHNISIEGEIGTVTDHRSGHLYFTLKDESAQIRGVMFSRMRKEGLKFPLETGQKVVVTGNITTYEDGSYYQILASAITRSGDGELYQRFLALKEELEEMGMFDASYKKPLPKFIRRVGIATSSEGAAIKDIISTVQSRNPLVQLYLMPCQVQGVQAATSIVKAIRYLDSCHLDVIIVGRGGGSMEDLWCFNERMVAEAIFECETPVISAVGHERDVTIADFVADCRAETPTRAGEFVTKITYQELCQMRDTYLDRLGMEVNHTLGRYRDKIERYQKTLGLLSPKAKLEKEYMALTGYEEKLTQVMKRIMERYRHQISLYATQLEGHSPLKKISAGFGYVEHGGKQVRHWNDVAVGEELKISLGDGVIYSKVTKTQEESVFGKQKKVGE
ncbi:MAG: exodeoxyribonuclease VII large subunit [Lachnospiraceae bacterium]|nr:exodeoxyribonuclease VII large subunit [Lachnospiraceae bacterium]